MSERVVRELRKLAKKKASTCDNISNSTIVELISLILKGETTLETDYVLDDNFVVEVEKCGVQLLMIGTSHAEGISEDINLYGTPLPSRRPTGWIYRVEELPLSTFE